MFQHHDDVRFDQMILVARVGFKSGFLLKISYQCIEIYIRLLPIKFPWYCTPPISFSNASGHLENTISDRELQFVAYVMNTES